MPQSVLPLPKSSEVTISIGPFDENLSGKTIRVFAVNEEDATDKTEVSTALGIPGAAKNSIYTILIDISPLVVTKEYRLVSYTDLVSSKRVTLIPNPDTPKPYRINVFDPDVD